MTLSVAFALALFAQVGLLTHLLTRISSLLGENGAAAAVSMVTTSAVLGRTLLGWTIGGVIAAWLHPRTFSSKASALH